MAQAENYQSGGLYAESTNSAGLDRRLFEADARVNAAHCDALFNAGVLTRVEAERIKNGLRAIVKRAGYDRNYFSEANSGDVHFFAETRLAQLVGDAAYKLNVGRSRNDHAATVFRLWLREEIEKIILLARAAQKALIAAAEKQTEAIVPFYARLGKYSQPMLWAHWCLADFERLARDRDRFDEVWRRVNVLPLGAGVSAGTNFEVDREETARALGFEGISLNSLDAVTDADYAIEFVSACALAASHLARLVEDLILFASDEFRFVEFAGENNADFPPKKSALELFIAKTARIYGNQTTLRNLPTISAANFGELEQAVFDAADTLKICLRETTTALETLRFREEKTRNARMENYAGAFELADYLLHKNVPYRAVCKTVSEILRHAAASEKRLNEISLAEMQKISTDIEPDVFGALDLENAVSAKSQIGGTAPERVLEALEAARGALEMEE